MPILTHPLFILLVAAVWMLLGRSGLAYNLLLNAIIIQLVISKVND